MHDQIGVIDTELIGLRSRMDELLMQRGELVSQIGAAGINGVDTSLGWLDEQYEVSITALGELGFDKRTLETEFPNLEQIKSGITDASVTWLNSQRASNGMHRRLVIAPRIQDVGLVGTVHEAGIITRFDKKQDAETELAQDLWDIFDDRDPVHDNGATEKWAATVLLGDTVDPRDSSKPANSYDEPGLVFTGLTVAEQRTELATEATTHKTTGRLLVSASIAQIVVANAQRRVEGLPLLDQRTFTRLTHYPDVPVDGSPYVTGVYSRGRLLGLSGSFSDINTWDYSGVRRALRIPVNL